ncbi:MAG: hypothetical protein AB8V50_12835 [Arsenophonus endosymbiont of Dermacentor nuttalli]
MAISCLVCCCEMLPTAVELSATSSVSLTESPRVYWKVFIP